MDDTICAAAALLKLSHHSFFENPEVGTYCKYRTLLEGMLSKCTLWKLLQHNLSFTCLLVVSLITLRL